MVQRTLFQVEHQDARDVSHVAQKIAVISATVIPEDRHVHCGKSGHRTLLPRELHVACSLMIGVVIMQQRCIRTLLDLLAISWHHSDRRLLSSRFIEKQRSGDVEVKEVEILASNFATHSDTVVCEHDNAEWIGDVDLRIVAKRRKYVENNALHIRWTGLRTWEPMALQLVSIEKMERTIQKAAEPPAPR